MLSLGRTLDGETLDTVEYAYDALGRIVSKSVGGKVAESYEYDIRGWARAITASGASNTDTERLMEYDLNGNRTLDSRTGLEFTHNLLNLPCDVRTFSVT